MLTNKNINDKLKQVGKYPTCFSSHLYYFNNITKSNWITKFKHTFTIK